MVKEPVKLTKPLSKKSDGKREYEGNKALRIPQKLVFIFHSPILPSAYPISHQVFFPARVKKKRKTKHKKQKKKTNESWSS